MFYLVIKVGNYLLKGEIIFVKGEKKLRGKRN